MKPHNFLLLLLITATLTGCELAGDLLQLGFWSAIILVVLVLAVIAWIARRFRGGGRRVP